MLALQVSCAVSNMLGRQRLPARVLLPVPLVPASSTVTLRRCSRMLRTHMVSV